MCQQFLNPLDSAPVQRALWNDLDEWSTHGIEPPPSQVPKLGTARWCRRCRRSRVGFPNIPGVTYTGLKTTRYRFNYGPNFYQTFVPTINPPVITPPYEDNSANGPIYPSYVPKTDSDGNDIAGIRLPELTVPLATYTGWGLRSGVWANDGCEATGQYIPFAATAARAYGGAAIRVPRSRSVTRPSPSIERRWCWRSTNWCRSRFLICDDTQDIVNRLLQAGITAGVPAPTANDTATAPDPVPACQARIRPHYHYHYVFDHDHDGDDHDHR